MSKTNDIDAARIAEHKAAGNRAARESYVAAMRDGRRLRPQTFADRKAKGRREACRGKFSANYDG